MLAYVQTHLFVYPKSADKIICKEATQVFRVPSLSPFVTAVANVAGLQLTVLLPMHTVAQ